jgi:hypothetical protein
MVISQPLVAHGVGGQDSDDTLWVGDGTDDQSGLVGVDQHLVWLTVPAQILIRIASLVERALDPSSHSILLLITCWPKRYVPLPHWSSASYGCNKPGQGPWGQA